MIFCWTIPAMAVPAFPENCKLIRLAALPIAIRHGHIVVDVKLNGRPFRFSVDTGGVFSAISSAAVKQLGLSTHPIRDNIRIQDAGGGEANRYARIETITIGTTRLENLTLMEATLPDGEDGVIAPEILRNFDVDLDFDQNLLSLFKPHKCDDHVVYWTDDYATIPFSITEQGHIRLDVELDGKPLHAMLDTGSPYTLIGTETLKSALPTKEAAAPSFGLKGGQWRSTFRFACHL
jgi:predicted aspartyl protease